MEFSSASPDTPGPPAWVIARQHPPSMCKGGGPNTWIHEHCAPTSTSGVRFDDCEGAASRGDIVVVKRDRKESTGERGIGYGDVTRSPFNRGEALDGKKRVGTLTQPMKM